MKSFNYKLLVFAVILGYASYWFVCHMTSGQQIQGPLDIWYLFASLATFCMSIFLASESYKKGRYY